LRQASIIAPSRLSGIACVITIQTRLAEQIARIRGADIVPRASRSPSAATRAFAFGLGGPARDSRSLDRRSRITRLRATRSLCGVPGPVRRKMPHVQPGHTPPKPSFQGDLRRARSWHEPGAASRRFGERHLRWQLRAWGRAEKRL